MCGIVAVVGRPSERPLPRRVDVVAGLDRALDLLSREPSHLTLGEAARLVTVVDRSLAGVPGVRALLSEPTFVAEVEDKTNRLGAACGSIDQRLDRDGLCLVGVALEKLSAVLVELKDAIWSINRDRVRTARAVKALAGEDARLSSLAALYAVQVALSSLDRLEVRGRDSAGLHIMVEGHGLDPLSPELARDLAERTSDPLFTSCSVRAASGVLSFVYKAAAEIGELGDNTAVLRRAITSDDLLRRALAAPTAQVTVLGHTRWASVGIISEANAHPLNQEEEGASGQGYVVAALNGDVDNYVELRDRSQLRIPAEITTDAKVIPSLVARRRSSGQGLATAFRETVADFDGSVAIAANAAEAPGRLLLALRGSGQALYVGLADDAYVVASEPYGLVEVTPRYLRLDGEMASGTSSQQGQVVVLDRHQAGTLEGIGRFSYDGTALPAAEAEIQTAEITTRDIDRAGFPHFLLKELSEAPASMRKTLRGKITESPGQRLEVRLDESILPAKVKERLAAGAIRRIVVVGQGTAAVAGQGVAAAIELSLGRSNIKVECQLATELSGFGLVDDMSDVIVVAVSQSGTTTDTNRTVDMARGRLASVLSIVNRRNSDLVEKSDGVLYTSDGRDVEMSVASTKAFYAMIAAGFLLAEGIAAAAGCADVTETTELLSALRQLPEAMEKVLARRDDLGRAAAAYAPSRRYWAVVGNGPNRVAAEEIRIKLSELCYKSIACDSTEDKKHIDLSSEPLIFVCAAGLVDANADDVAKEIGIYRAHKAAPVMVVTEGEADRFPAALAVIEVPAIHSALAFVLSAMAGHLFGYEAALAIDAQARPLREARAAIESAVSATSSLGAGRLLDHLGAELAGPVASFSAGLRDGSYDGHLEASTAVRINSLLRYGTGLLSLDTYELDIGKVGSPATVVQDLAEALTAGIDQLTRPIDAIKHQAKTVTVGISRSEDTLFEAKLVRATFVTGTGRDQLGYGMLRTLSALGPAVAEVTGWTRYAIEGSLSEGTASAHVVARGGIAAELPSRTERNPRLRGTKHRAATQRQVTVVRGLSDGRTVIIVPEVKGDRVTGLALLHVRFHATLESSVARSVLHGYQGRYAALVDAVTETEPTMSDDVLGMIPIGDLLTEPVNILARRWRQSAGAST